MVHGGDSALAVGLAVSLPPRNGSGRDERHAGEPMRIVDQLNRVQVALTGEHEWCPAL